jgi:iron(III) transport system permease protein
LVAGFIAAVLGVAVWASFVTYWPYNLSLSLKNYNFEDFEPNGSGPYFASLAMAALAAVLGTAVVFSGAYLIEKGQGFRAGRALAHLLAMLPMAVPGLVLGLGYVFFINAKWNPLGVLYGTILLLAINSIAHFYTTAHVTAVTALKQIDNEFEAVSASLKVPFYRTFARVTVPGVHAGDPRHCRLHVRQCAHHGVGGDLSLRRLDQARLDLDRAHGRGRRHAAAAAMATLIVLTALAVKVLHLVLDRLVFGKLQAWRRR